ncbi:MAG: glycosyltransferase family 2 protein [Draconibacterium sp.]
MHMKKNNLLISVVVPCYNEAKNIVLIVAGLEAVLIPLNYEILLIDDGSTDESENIYRQLAETDERVKFLRFSRNFGHQAALKAGIDHAKGDAVLTIDADLQQPPTLIPAMIKSWQEGADIVEGIRRNGNKGLWAKQKISYLFYHLLGYLSDYPVVGGVSDFRLIDKKVANVVRQLPENQLYLRGLFNWIGFKHTYIYYQLQKRQNGGTKYTFAKMFGLASSGLTSTSIKPLRIALVFGTITSLFSFMYAGYALYVSLRTEQAVPGWTSTILSVLFMAGMQLIVLGIIGEYLGKLFMENKRRPVYIVSDTNIGWQHPVSGNNLENIERGHAMT